MSDLHQKLHYDSKTVGSLAFLELRIDPIKLELPRKRLVLMKSFSPLSRKQAEALTPILAQGLRVHSTPGTSFLG